MFATLIDWCLPDNLDLLSECLKQRRFAQRIILSVAFSADGSQMVLGFHDKTIAMLEVSDSSARVCPRIAPLWQTLTRIGYSTGSHGGAGARKDGRPQQRGRVGRVFPGRDQDCLGIRRHDDQGLGCGCAAGPQGLGYGYGCAAGPQPAPPWPKLTPMILADRQSRSAEREGGRPQQDNLLGRVLSGRDQDCLGIARWDDQGLGFRCAPGSPPVRTSFAPKLTRVGLPCSHAGAVGRDGGRPQQRGHVGGVFPGRDQDRVRIGQQDAQGLGFWCIH